MNRIYKRVVGVVLCFMLLVSMVSVISVSGEETAVEEEMAKGAPGTRLADVLKGIGVTLYFNEKAETVPYDGFLKTMFDAALIGKNLSAEQLQKFVLDGDYVYNENIYTEKSSVSVTYKDACYSMIKALGFADYAADLGSYPTGVLNLAQSFDLNDGIEVSADSKLTGEQALNMLYNFLIAPYRSTHTDLIVFFDYSCILTDCYNIYEGEGTVEANEFTGLYSEKSAVDEGKIKIGGEVYEIPGYETDTLVGKYVDFLYKENGTLDEIVYIELDDKINDEIVLDADQIQSGSTETTIVYYDDKDARRSVALSSDVVVIYNGVASPDWNVSMILADAVKSGTVTLVRNKKAASGYSVIYINDYDTVWLKYVDMKDYIIMGYYGERIELKKLISDNKLIIQDAEGNGLKVTDLKAAQVLWISENDKFVKIIAASETVSGTIDRMMSDGEIIVGDNEYKLSRSYYDIPEKKRVVLKAGIGVKLYFDAAGKVYGVEKSAAAQVNAAYLIAVENAGLNEICIRAFDTKAGEKIFNLAEKNKVEGKTVTSAEEIKAMIPDTNKEFINSATGESYSNGIRRQLFIYELDQNGDIKKIDFASRTVEPNDTESLQLIHNTTTDSGELHYRSESGSFNGQVLANSSAEYILVNIKQAELDMENFQIVNNGYFKTQEEYSFEAYSIGNSFLPDFFVIFPASMLNEERLVMFDEVYSAVNASGDIVDMLVCHRARYGEVNHYTLEVKDCDLSKYQKGDILWVGVDFKERIISETMVYDHSEGYAGFYSTYQGLDFLNQISISYFTPQEAKDSYFKGTIKNNAGTDITHYVNLAKFNILWYDSEMDEVVAGTPGNVKTIEDFGLNDHSRLVIYYHYGAAQAAFLFDK